MMVIGTYLACSYLFLVFDLMTCRRILFQNLHVVIIYVSICYISLLKNICYNVLYYGSF